MSLPATGLPATIEYANGKVILLDQTLLPLEKIFLEIPDAQTMWEAIKVLRVRGAPAIGGAAAFGLWLGVREIVDDATRAEFLEHLQTVRDYLATSRPTAVNLFWALDRVNTAAKNSSLQTAGGLKKLVLEEALAIQREDIAMCRAIGEHGANELEQVLPAGSSILTHCNAGALATMGLGTALAPVYVSLERGRAIHVFADETRPLLQGARITAWELHEAGVPVTLITDNMAATVMRGPRINSSDGQKVGAVIVGTDRVAANGDFANKIGTYGVALLARAHNIPFYVAAPSSTIDLNTPNGEEIEIELRDREEVTSFGARVTAPEGIQVFNPAFDVTPGNLVTGFITERGVIRAPYLETLAGF
jgi:methylthioribose-1-phosphate isomerase